MTVVVGMGVDSNTELSSANGGSGLCRSMMLQPTVQTTDEVETLPWAWDWVGGADWIRGSRMTEPLTADG